MCDYEYRSIGRVGEKCKHKRYTGSFADGKEYCVFHNPSDSRDEDYFWKELFKLIDRFKAENAKEWDFEGFIFPETGQRFAGYKFPKNSKINFIRAKFNDSKNNISFEDAEFNGQVDFIDVLFSCNVNFGGTKFKDQADFRSSVFQSSVNFEWSEYKKGVVFLNTSFKGSVIFEGAIFNGGVDFTWSNFSEGVAFQGMRCDGKMDYSRSKFDGRVDFQGTIFKEEVDFKYSYFSGNTMFSEVIFEKKADFIETEFKDDTDFLKASFKSKAIFTLAKFRGNTDFSEAIFEDDLIFNYAVFEGNARFNKTYFGRYTMFYQVIFHSIASFHNAWISDLDFTGTLFNLSPILGPIGSSTGRTKIRNLICNSNIIFDRRSEQYQQDDIKFRKVFDREYSVSLVNCIISGSVKIAQNVRRTIFRRCVINSDIDIRPSGSVQFGAVEVIFNESVTIERSKILGIKNCVINSEFNVYDSNMACANFKSTDLSRIDFENVEWIEVQRPRSSIVAAIPRLVFRIVFLFKKCRNRRFFCRKTLALNDETALGKDEFCQKKNKSRSKKKLVYAPSLKGKNEEDLIKIEELYRQIANSYESRRRYGLAGHFKAAEFEIKRRHAGWLEKLILLLYRWSSFYGEEVIKPLLLLLSLPFISALLFLWLVNGWYLSWEAIYPLNFNGFGILWKDFLQTFTCGLQGLNPTFIYPACYPQPISTIIGLLEKIFAALFTSLFLFALRRRVKR